MSANKMESVFNIVVLALQICLAVWQFTKLTPVGALIQGVVGWLMSLLLRPFRLSSPYVRLQCCNGRVFKKVNCYVLQADIPFERTGIHGDGVNIIQLNYLGVETCLERSENKLFVQGKFCYYITDRIWEELHTLRDVLDGHLVAKSYAALYPVFIRSVKDFWEEMIMGGIMWLDEVLDEVILHNQRVSLPLNNHWLLPVDVLVSEEKLLKVLNLFALFLQTKKDNSFIPLALSLSSALLEFNINFSPKSSPISMPRVWLYTCINVLFCNIVHFICDPLPLSWRRQVYSLGMWVENLKPCNDIELKVVRGNITAILTAGANIYKGDAEIDKEGTTLVHWLDVPHDQIKMHFSCNPNGGDICCTYVRDYQICVISAPTIGDVYVDCKSMDDFKQIVKLVSCIAKNCCGSLISYGPKNKVSVRGFKESLISYVKNGLPPIYELKLENVVVV